MKTKEEYIKYCLPFLLGEKKQFHHYELGDIGLSHRHMCEIKLIDFTNPNMYFS